MRHVPEYLMHRLEVRKDWKFILKKAWSSRIILLAGFLTALEFMAMTAWDHGLFALPPWVFPGAMGLLMGVALVARILAQKEFD